MALRESLDRLNANAMLPSTIRRLLGPYSPEARVVLSVLSQEPRVIRRLRMYDEELVNHASSAACACTTRSWSR